MRYASYFPLRFLRLSILFLFWALLPVAYAEPLEQGESVLFFPAITAFSEEEPLILTVDAWVFEEESRPFFETALNTWLGRNPDEEPPEAQARFRERARYFQTEARADKQIFVRIGKNVHSLPPTDARGRTSGQITIYPDDVQWQENGAGHAAFSLEAPEHAAHGQESYGWIVPRAGVFVVSDIDDAIKDSSVRDKKALVKKSLFEPFTAIEGMAAWYRELADTNEGTFFCYLSGSPAALYPALVDFLQKENFPAGALYLRDIRARDLLSSKKTSLKTHKTTALEQLARDFPQRRFILIGDSGESDPEIYADFARHYPERVLSIHIRDVTSESRDAARYAQTFLDLAPSLWNIRE
ncbi:MAG: DUF2183 domain-containing protein [Zoogloeaceae bacterium]|jgi:hypothetical protein|nr:DUF2183 domain-containing protein [Zoogloeaceae bacterium]